MEDMERSGKEFKFKGRRVMTHQCGEERMEKERGKEEENKRVELRNLANLLETSQGMADHLSSLLFSSPLLS